MSPHNSESYSQQEMERKINEALQAYSQEIPNAHGEAERTLAQGAGYAIRRVNTAKGDAGRFTALLAEYQKAPGVTRRRLYLAWIRSEAYRQAEEGIGKADAEAAAIYAAAYGQEPEFYTFLKTFETYKQTLQKNSSLVLTTGSDFYRYLKNALPNGGEPAPNVSSTRR